MKKKKKRMRKKSIPRFNPTAAMRGKNFISHLKQTSMNRKETATQTAASRRKNFISHLKQTAMKRKETATLPVKKKGQRSAKKKERRLNIQFVNLKRK